MGVKVQSRNSFNNIFFIVIEATAASHLGLEDCCHLPRTGQGSEMSIKTVMRGIQSIIEVHFMVSNDISHCSGRWERL